MRKALAIAAFLMTGCTHFAPVGRVGPPLLTDCGGERKVVLVVQFVDSLDEVNHKRATMARVGEGPTQRVEAFTGFTEDGTAVVVTPVIRGQLDTARIETLGHEVAHALCGNWHPPHQAQQLPDRIKKTGSRL